ncbi:MAG: CPBP family intramembrane glutamic endopeptidase [Actinomycetota bacterium]
MSLAIGISLLLVAYNNTINLWRPFHSWAYVPCNLALTLVLVAVAPRPAPIGDATDALLGAAVVLPVAIALLLISRSQWRMKIVDERVAGLSGGALAYHTLLRIPVGTGVTEEIAFRGVLFDAWLVAGLSTSSATLAASVAFGLWHVAPTLVGLKMNDPETTRQKAWLAVAGAVVATTVVGLAFTWLRLRTDSLLAPIVVHAGVNSVAAFASAKAAQGRPAL